MSEKEKMLNGKPYKAFAEKLLGERQYTEEMIVESYLEKERTK